jgi:hypothetical protein
MDQTRKLMTTAMLITIASVLSLLLYIVPILQVGLFVVAIPMTLVGIKYDWQYQLLALLALLFILLTIEPLYAIYVISLIGPLAVAQGYMLHRKKNDSEVIFFGALAVAFGLLILLYVSNIFMDMNMMEEMKKFIVEVTDQMKTFYSQTEVLETADLQSYLDNLDHMKDAIILLMPAILMFYGLYTSILCFITTKAVFKRIGIPMKKHYFKDFRIDRDKRFYLMLIMGIVTAAAFIDRLNMDYYIMNCMTVLFLVLQINGFALVWFLTDKHPNKKALRIILVILYLVSPMIAIAELFARFGLAIVGFVDMYIDIRLKISQKKQS